MNGNVYVTARDLNLLFAESDLYKEKSDLIGMNARLATVSPTFLKRKGPLPHVDDGTHSPSRREFFFRE